MDPLLMDCFYVADSADEFKVTNKYKNLLRR